MCQWWKTMLKNRLIYAALFCTSFLFIYFWGGKVPYMLFYTVALLPFLSLIYLYFAFIGLKYNQHIDITKLSKGESFNYVFTIHNRSLLLFPYIKVFYLNLDKTINDKEIICYYSANPLSKRPYQYSVMCNNRGVYDVGIKRIEFIDFLGIFRFVKEPENLFSITVYPKVVLLDDFNMSSYNESEVSGIKKSILNSPTNITDIRKYITGDSFRSIHWKLTAKKNEFMVKDKHSIADFNTVILLDLNYCKNIDDRIAVADILVESAIALVYYCLSNSRSIKLLYFNNSLTTFDANIFPQFNDVYETLSKVKLQEDISLIDIIHSVPMENTTRANYFIITTNVDGEMFDEIIVLKQSGHNPYVIFVVSPNAITGYNDESYQILEALEGSGIRTYIIKNDFEIKEVLEQG
jgi:uncharacterized protein (DUF58 family)